MAFKVPDNLTSATPTQKQKIKTPFARIIVSHIEDHAHFSIIWWDIQTMTMREGYSSYSLKFVQKWLDEEFEIDEHARAELLVKTRDAAPTVDAVEVVHGQWILKSRIHKMFDDVDEEFYVECNLCNREEPVCFEFGELQMLEYAKQHYPYCHCGAKMDGGNQDAEK